jgi:hypothetical protein
MINRIVHLLLLSRLRTTLCTSLPKSVAGWAWDLEVTSHQILCVATPLWDKCEGEAHTPKSGKLESSRTPENLELDFRGQISSHSSVLYVIGKVLKCRCPKWPRMSHSDIFSPSYRQKKGRESNWQFDSRPLKVRNRPLSNVYSRSATWRWKAPKESYNFSLNLVPIQAWGEKLWTPKVPGVQTGTISGLHPGKKSHSDVAFVRSCREYYKGEGGGFPRVRAVVSQVSPSRPWLVPTPKGCRKSSNQLMVGFGCRTN